jgi:hypothetical protein
MNDSIIQEVRAIRDQHAASMGYNLDRIYADLKARQEKHKADGWVIVAPPDIQVQSENRLALHRVRFAHAEY